MRAQNHGKAPSVARVREAMGRGHFGAALEAALAYQDWIGKQAAGHERIMHEERCTFLLGKLFCYIGDFGRALPKLLSSMEAGDLEDGAEALLLALDAAHGEEENLRLASSCDTFEERCGRHTEGTEGRRYELLCRYARAWLSRELLGSENAAAEIREVLQDAALWKADRVAMRMRLATILRFCDNPFEAEQESRQALLEAEGLGDHRLELKLRYRVAAFVLEGGNHEEARFLYQTLATDLEGSGLFGDQADVSTALGELVRHQGKLEAARAWYERAIEAWIHLGSEYAAGFPRFNLVAVLLDQGDHRAASAHVDVLVLWADALPRFLQRAVELQRIRYLFLSAQVDEALAALDSLLDEDTSFAEVDDALALEWIIARLLDLPAERRSSSLLFMAAKALGSAAELWMGLERSEELDRVNVLRGRLGSLA